MNILSYGLLSLLAQSSFSGYDLMLRIQPFWPAKHSQIYPLLAKLEKDELIRYELVCQSDKPDKKVYSLTVRGREILKQWIWEPSAEPAMRDEMMLKLFCLSYADRDSAKKLFNDRLAYHAKKLKIYEEKLLQLQNKEEWPREGMPPYASPLFGAYLLTQKAVMSTKSSIDWCEWALNLLSKPCKSCEE